MLSSSISLIKSRLSFGSNRPEQISLRNNSLSSLFEFKEETSDKLLPLDIELQPITKNTSQISKSEVQSNNLLNLSNTFKDSNNWTSSVISFSLNIHKFFIESIDSNEASVSNPRENIYLGSMYGIEYKKEIEKLLYTKNEVHKRIQFHIDNSGIYSLLSKFNYVGYLALEESTINQGLDFIMKKMDKYKIERLSIVVYGCAVNVPLVIYYNEKSNIVSRPIELQYKMYLLSKSKFEPKEIVIDACKTNSENLEYNFKLNNLFNTFFSDFSESFNSKYRSKSVNFTCFISKELSITNLQDINLDGIFLESTEPTYNHRTSGEKSLNKQIYMRRILVINRQLIKAEINSVVTLAKVCEKVLEYMTHENKRLIGGDGIFLNEIAINLNMIDFCIPNGTVEIVEGLFKPQSINNEISIESLFYELKSTFPDALYWLSELNKKFKDLSNSRLTKISNFFVLVAELYSSQLLTEKLDLYFIIKQCNEKIKFAYQGVYSSEDKEPLRNRIFI